MRIVSILLVMTALAFQTAAIASTETAGGPNQAIQWMTAFEEALARGRAENKPVFLDFFNPK